MIKMREAWPVDHNSELIEPVKARRTCIVVEEGQNLYACHECRVLQGMAEEMVATPSNGVEIVSGHRVKEWEARSIAWVDWASR